MKRRTFIAGLGSAAAWPVVTRAQQAKRMRRIGVFINLTADDPQSLARATAFAQGLAELGWTIGRNVQIDYRWGPDQERYRAYAAELVALAPDVIVCNSTLMTRALQQATRTVPIVFAGLRDPVGGGLVATLARPGGNTTGFMSTEYGAIGKLPELLKQIVPGVTRAAVLRDPIAPGGNAQLGAIQAVAPFLAMEVSPIDARDANEIESAIATFAREANRGLLVMGGGPRRSPMALLPIYFGNREASVKATMVFPREPERARVFAAWLIVRWYCRPAVPGLRLGRHQLGRGDPRTRSARYGSPVATPVSSRWNCTR